jgi:hypothetical protein
MAPTTMYGPPQTFDRSGPLVQTRLNLRETEQILDRAYAHLKALRDELARQEREACRKEARS